jgi:TolB-like protein/tRNA A-37 threonylcarbamoyl transferase component Bud32/Tfp pilus assembly protein PilF
MSEPRITCDEEPGTRIGRYRIVAALGAGGMGAVYRARDERLDRDIALKILPCDNRSDENARARLVREARTGSSLNHPNIAHVYEVGDDGDHVYLAMELVEGRTLHDAIPPGGFPAETLLEYGLQVAGALGYAHEHGVIHRDLKSTNIMITNEGAAKVLDFGLAKRVSERAEAAPVDPSLTVSGMVLGTPNHLAPEVLRGETADARGDVWAFGIVLYEMASGQYPFRGASMVELASAIVSETPAKLSGRVPVGVQAVIARCLAKEPSLRYHTGSEVRAALEALLGVAQRRRLRRGSRLTWAAMSMAAAILALVAGAWFLGPRVLPGRQSLAPAVAPAPSVRSLAVLPLSNLSGDPAQEYFADGMTEELITRLAPIPGLKVISRTSVMRFKGSKESLRDIARALDVDAVVEGSVQRDGDRVRVTAQLIEAASDRHLWAKSFDRDFREVLSLQSEVAGEIAREIQMQISPQMSARMASAQPMNPQAYELYLKGRFEWNKLTPEGLERGLDYYKQAQAIDPGDARYSSGIADAYLVLSHVFGRIPPAEAMPKVKEYARRALAADPNSAEAHASMAAALFFDDWDVPQAEREIRQSIALNPNYATGRLVSSVIHLSQGRINEAIAEDRKAIELDPFSIFHHWNAIGTLRVAHRYDEAFALARRALEIDPEAFSIHAALVRIHEQRRDYEAALAVIEQHMPAGEGGRAAAAKLRRAWQEGGEAGYWREALAQARARGHPAETGAVSLAFFHVRLGDRARALDYLEQALEQHSSDMIFLKVEPCFEPLRGEPRYQALIDRIEAQSRG